MSYLILANGSIFEGSSCGAGLDALPVIGEIVFTTGMTGYLETLTDPSYAGQIILQTFPLIGNYGTITPDLESSAVSAKAYIVKSICQDPSNFRSEGGLDIFLKDHKIPALSGIDTREVTKLIRESGVMNGMLTASLPPKEKLPDILEEIRAYRISDVLKTVSVKEEQFTKSEESRHRVALFDFGLKENIRRCLLERGCDVYTLPYNATAADIARIAPDGIMLSNGPGDPDDPANADVIKNITEIADMGIPIFGICLGHQIMALAHGFSTEKLRYGHRGANQPVKDLMTGRVYITSQNHGYAVTSSTIKPGVGKGLFVNVNDSTNEGIQYSGKNVFTTQFHPEACGGPRDTAFLFDRFINLMIN
ncbi:carbamoyl-phosphate synthase small chain [Clostridia bacterium]|nr:carbamoyl-phosphate synthase small chain [Clostridia bacterium]